MKQILEQLKELWEEQARQPDPDRSFGALILGDDYVLLAVAEKRSASDEDQDAEEGEPGQLDFDTCFPGFDGEQPLDEEVKGGFRTYRLELVKFHLDIGVTPGVELIKRAFLRCWNTMQSKGRIRCKRFYVCLPTWSCRGELVQEEILTGPEGQTLFDVRPRVTAEHVRLLQDRAVMQAEKDGYEAVDLCAHYYQLDTGRKVMPPENESSTSLELRGYVTLAHGALLRELLTQLRRKQIVVDRIVTPADACGGMLYNDQLQYGTVVIEVGSRATCCSYFEKGHLVRQDLMPVGSEKVFHDISNVERIPLTSLRNSFQREAGGHEMVTRVEDAPLPWGQLARCSIRELATQVFSRLEVDPAEDFARIKHVLVTGDDVVTCRAFRDYLREELQLPCCYPIMEGHELNEQYDAKDAWRLLGMFELATNEAVESRRHYAIEKYMKPIEGRIMIALERHGRRLFRARSHLVNAYVRQLYGTFSELTQNAVRRL